jgi:predicted small secreted protein
MYDSINDNYNMRNSMLRTIRVIVLLLAVIVGTSTVTACNTISGVGRDVEAVGESLRETAQDNKSY